MAITSFPWSLTVDDARAEAVFLCEMCRVRRKTGEKRRRPGNVPTEKIVSRVRR